MHKLAKRLQDDRRKKVSPQGRKVLELHRPRAHTHTHTQVHTQSQAAGPGTHSMPTHPAQGSPSSSFLGLPCYNMQPLRDSDAPLQSPTPWACQDGERQILQTHASVSVTGARSNARSLPRSIPECIPTGGSQTTKGWSCVVLL